LTFRRIIKLSRHGIHNLERILSVTSEPRTVVLHRSRKGFGFVLRGAKATSPLMELTPSARYPALQYLDDVDQGGVADLAGLRKGDFLIQVSPQNELILFKQFKKRI